VGPYRKTTFSAQVALLQATQVTKRARADKIRDVAGSEAGCFSPRDSVKESSTFNSRKRSASGGKSTEPINVEMLEIMRGVGSSIRESTGTFTTLVGQLGQLVNLLGAGGIGAPAAVPTIANPAAERTKGSEERSSTPGRANDNEDGDL
jgi:hypothetical protein